MLIRTGNFHLERGSWTKSLCKWWGVDVLAFASYYVLKSMEFKNSSEWAAVRGSEKQAHLLNRKICTDFICVPELTQNLLCGKQQENLSIKGMDFAAQRDSLPGFPLWAWKLTGKGQSQPVLSSSLWWRMFIFPGGESEEAGKATIRLSLKRGCLGTLFFLRNEPASPEKTFARITIKGGYLEF